MDVDEAPVFDVSKLPLIETRYPDGTLTYSYEWKIVSRMTLSTRDEKEEGIKVAIQTKLREKTDDLFMAIVINTLKNKGQVRGNNRYYVARKAPPEDIVIINPKRYSEIIQADMKAQNCGMREAVLGARMHLEVMNADLNEFNGIVDALLAGNMVSTFSLPDATLITDEDDGEALVKPRTLTEQEVGKALAAAERVYIGLMEFYGILYPQSDLDE